MDAKTTENAGSDAIVNAASAYDLVVGILTEIQFGGGNGGGSPKLVASKPLIRNASTLFAYLGKTKVKLNF